MKSNYDAFRVKLRKRTASDVSIAKGKGAVASVSRQASAVGIKVLKDGGNAFDAAFALAFALTVYHPQAGNIGGGGYVVFKERGRDKPRIINYREKSPSGAKRGFYLKPDGSVDPDLTAFGPGSVCVPGTVKAFYELQKNRGVLKAQDLLEYISRLAIEGTRLNQYQVQCLNRLSSKLSVSPESKRNYVKKEGYFQSGDIVRNPNLSRTLATLAREGERSFYEGSIAEQIEKDITGNGGFLTVEDLKRYAVREVQPLFSEVSGKKVWAVPPEGGGAVLIEILNILNRDRFFEIEPFTPGFYHFLAQACKRAFVDRCYYLGDIPLNRNKIYKSIFEKDYTDRIFSAINSRKDIKTCDLVSLIHPDENCAPDLERPVRGGNETTHFSIIDREGNAVSNSYSLNLRYGSKWSVDGAGFLLNGSIDAFAFSPGKPNYFGVVGNEPNLFDADKRPVSYMSPVIVTDGGGVEMIIGTPGGPAIPSTIALLILTVLGHNRYPPEAVSRARIHHQAWPDILYKEKDTESEAAFKSLLKMGYDIKAKDEPIGDIHGIFAHDGEYCAVSDFRREGCAIAY